MQKQKERGGKVDGDLMANERDRNNMQGLGPHLMTSSQSFNSSLKANAYHGIVILGAGKSGIDFIQGLLNRYKSAIN